MDNTQATYAPIEIENLTGHPIVVNCETQN